MSTVFFHGDVDNNGHLIGHVDVQSIYDWREKEEIMSSAELHDFFDAISGNPSPSGKSMIELEDIEVLANSESKRESYTHTPAQVAQFILSDLDIPDRETHSRDLNERQKNAIDFKEIGREYSENYAYESSEDAWESAISNDEGVIEALKGMTADEREIAADDFGMGFANG